MKNIYEGRRNEETKMNDGKLRNPRKREVNTE